MKPCRALLFGIGLIFISACGKQTVRPDAPEASEQTPATQAQLAELKNILTTLNSRMDGLETKVNGHENKLADHRAPSGPAPIVTPKMTTVAVTASPAQSRGQEIQNPEQGFASGQVIQAFRKAKIELDSKRYPEAVLAFTQFMDRYADHVLAGQAQYYIGLAYSKQGEHKLALQEFNRVLTAYDRSPYLAETLRALADSEDHLGKREEAARHRQMLHAMFPQSPAAKHAQTEVSPQHHPEVPPTAPQTNSETPEPRETPEASSDHT